VAAAFAVIPASAQAATEEIVTKLEDTNDNICSPTDCSLREAVYEANQAPDGTTIRFATGLTGTISLGSAGTQLTLVYPGGIEGPGADKLIIDQLAPERVINFSAAGTGFLEGVTVTGGYADGLAAGGGVRGFQTDLTIHDAVITGNYAYGGGGGGLAIEEGGLTMTGSTVSGNAAYSNGAGIEATASSVEIVSSTIYDNSTDGLGSGAGIHVAGGTGVTLRDSSVTKNIADESGGGIWHYAADLTLNNTIVAENAAAVIGPDMFTPVPSSGSVESAFSLIGNPAGADLVQTGPNVLGVAPLLGPLQANGGPTPTRMPLQGSPAIDKGSSSAPTDQRGLPRLIDDPLIAPAAGGNNADIGAAEAPVYPPAVTPPVLRKKKKCKKPKKKTPAAKKKFKKCKKKLRKRPA
jgi:CSLREA domain-containing protein